MAALLVVSIPSEVGRGRAQIHVDEERNPRDLPFQSPRRWGGVGLKTRPRPQARASTLSFNSLGGGAGSGSRLANSES